MEEPSFQLQRFAKDAPAYAWKYFQFHLKPEVPVETIDLFEPSDASDSGETDSSSSSSSSSSEQPVPPATQQGEECADEIFGALHRSMWHVSMEAPAEHLDEIRTACGRRFPIAPITSLAEVSLTPGQSLCSHPGCRKGWKTTGFL
jgi:hypothetical protein